MRHRPFRADEWLLYESASPSASGARGLATGRFWTQGGRHIATVVQEGLMRPPRGSEQAPDEPPIEGGDRCFVDSHP